MPSCSEFVLAGEPDARSDEGILRKQVFSGIVETIFPPAIRTLADYRRRPVHLCEARHRRLPRGHRYRRHVSCVCPRTWGPSPSSRVICETLISRRSTWSPLSGSSTASTSTIRLYLSSTAGGKAFIIDIQVDVPEPVTATSGEWAHLTVRRRNYEIEVMTMGM